MAYNYEFPYTDPNLYNDDWILKKMKDLLVWMEETEAWKLQYENAYQEMKKMVEDIENGTFPDSIKKAFSNWMKKNALDLVGELVKLVFFGLNDDGYWVAYIPESWNDIIFNTTGLDIIIPAYPEYGRLVLSLLVGGN